MQVNDREWVAEGAHLIRGLGYSILLSKVEETLFLSGSNVQRHHGEEL